MERIAEIFVRFVVKRVMRRLTELDAVERRVLGVLLEKERTTPEYYPLTLKAAVSACNQKSNRDPVLDLSESDVLNALRLLCLEGLAGRESGARVDRYRHRLEQVFRPRTSTWALLTLLILRGPQTLGELRTRGERMHSFASLEEVSDALRDLQEEDSDLIVEIPRRPGQKESRWALSLEGIDLEFEASSNEEPAAPGLGERVRRLEERVAELESALKELRG